MFSAWGQRRKSLHSGGFPVAFTQASMMSGSAVRLGSRGVGDPQWAQKQFCKQPHHCTVVTHYKYCAKWASRLASYNAKMALPQYLDDSAMANQSSHAWVTSTSSRFRVLWKYMHSEVLWITPNNSEYLFCYTNESKQSLPHYLQSPWRKWISVYIVSV